MADLRTAGGRGQVPVGARPSAQAALQVIGTLNLFGTDLGQMQAADVHVVRPLADVATIGLLQERAVRLGEVLAEQLQCALNSRVIIEQAKGAVAQIHGCTVDEAFRHAARLLPQPGLRLGVVAYAVLTDPASVPDLTVR